MKAGECMVREFQAIHPDAPVEEVLRRLGVPGAEPIPVCDGNRLIGMVGYKDVAAGVAADVRRAGPVRARDVVAVDVIYCRETTELREATELMRENDVPLVPVLNAEGRIVGILRLAALPGSGGPERAETADPAETNNRGATHLRL